MREIMLDLLASLLARFLPFPAFILAAPAADAPTGLLVEFADIDAGAFHVALFNRRSHILLICKAT